MNALTDYQIIEQGGKPAFVVIPYKEFVQLKKHYGIIENGLIPQEIVVKNAIDGVSLVKAWRQYLNWTQERLAEKSGMKQSALARIESGAIQPRFNTLTKLAKAMSLNTEQLIEE